MSPSAKRLASSCSRDREPSVERIVRNARAVTDTRNATQQVRGGRETIVLA